MLNFLGLTSLLFFLPQTSFRTIIPHLTLAAPPLQISVYPKSNTAHTTKKLTKQQAFKFNDNLARFLYCDKHLKYVHLHPVLRHQALLKFHQMMPHNCDHVQTADKHG